MWVAPFIPGRGWYAVCRENKREPYAWGWPTPGDNYQPGRHFSLAAIFFSGFIFWADAPINEDEIWSSILSSYGICFIVSLARPQCELGSYKRGRRVFRIPSLN